ncbi:hypothetical protein PS15p_201982 [Mucor circinelloides]
MFKSRNLLFLSLIWSGHAVFGNYIPRSLSEVSSLLSATSSGSSSSFHHSLKAKPSSSPSLSYYSPQAGTEQALTLNLTESAILQIVNHGSNDTKIVVYDYDVQIGETGLGSHSFNISLAPSHKINMELISLDAGEHILYLIPRYNNGSHVSSTNVNADIRILPKAESRIIKRWNSNQGNNQNAIEEPFNAIVEWTIDPEEDEKESYKQKKKYGKDDDDDDDDDEEDDDDDDDDDEDDYDDDDEDDDDEKSWKWDNNSGWKSQHSKKYKKHDKIVKVFVPVSDCLVPSSNNVAIIPSTLSTSSTPALLSSSAETSSSSTLEETSESEPSTSSTPIDPTVTPTSPTIVMPASIKSSSSSPSSTTESEDPEPTTENVIIRTETIAGSEVTVIEGRSITVTDAKEVTVLVGRATTTTEKETVIANTITFAIETITQEGQTLTQAGATETVAGATVTIAGPPVTFVALTETVQGPAKTLTKFILQQTTKTTVLTQINDFVTVTQTQINPIFETVFGATSTRTENVVITVLRPTSSV